MLEAKVTHQMCPMARVKTGHSDYSANKRTTVPGSGGGSTSIRIGSNTNYSRVIAADGAGGCFNYEDPGCLSGGNGFYTGNLQSQGAGNQAGSTRGLDEGSDRNGDPGQFGLEATGKYRQGCDSGGGFGKMNYCSSGSGSSGWIFNES